MPPRIIGLRPTLSDSQPKKMSDGVPITSPMPTIQEVVKPSSFDTCCMKYSAQNWPLVPDHALTQHDDGGDDHVLQVGGVAEGFPPGILAGLPLGLDLRVDRRFFESPRM